MATKVDANEDGVWDGWISGKLGEGGKLVASGITDEMLGTIVCVVTRLRVTCVRGKLDKALMFINGSTTINQPKRMLKG